MHRSLFIIFSLFCSLGFSQIDPNAYGYYDYAQRFTTQNNYGSPRMNALGGASTALGGDYSQHISNPAGLGIYQQNDIGFSFGNDYNTFHHNEPNSNSTQNQFNINSLGIVIAQTHYDKGWRNNAIGFSFNRLGSFISPLNYSTKSQHSLRNFLVNSAEGTHYTEFANQLNDKNEVINLYGLAYHTFLLNEKDQNSSPSSYFTFSPNEANTIDESISYINRNTQYNFSYGGGIEDTYYFGISFGFKNIHERKLREYKETPDNGVLQSVILNEEESSKGIGANLSLGFIYRPTNKLRIGISYQGPTTITINENYKANLVALYDNYTLPNGETLNKEEANTSSFTTNYTIKEPFTTRLGIAYLIKEKLLIALDGKYQALQKLKLSSSEFDLKADNNTIKNIHNNQYTVALGVEYKNKNSYIRTGFNTQTNGYKNSSNASLKRYSLGLGQYLKKGVFLDITYVYQELQPTSHRPYTNASSITTNGKRQSLQCGLHFIFE